MAIDSPVAATASTFKWSAGLKLVDIAREEKLFQAPRVTSSQLEKSTTDPLANNPLVDTIRQFSEYLGEELAMQPLPDQIQPRHVARRLKALSEASDDNPLRSLAEMHFYVERGLSDKTQLLLSYQALIGMEQGSELMLGDAAAKKRVLKPWLPPPPSDDAPPSQRLSSHDDD